MMKFSMLFGGVFYALRGIAIAFPFIITALFAIIPLRIAGSGDLSATVQEPLWIIAIASVGVAFIEEHYYREREYEAFVISIVGTLLVFGMTALFYLSAQRDVIYLAYLLLILGLVDFLLAFEYQKPGHTGRKRMRGQKL